MFIGPLKLNKGSKVSIVISWKSIISYDFIHQYQSIFDSNTGSVALFYGRWFLTHTLSPAEVPRANLTAIAEKKMYKEHDLDCREVPRMHGKP